MFFHRLNVNIAINLIFLLGIATLLINIVIISSARSLLVKSEISKGNLILTSIENYLSICEDMKCAPRLLQNSLNKILNNSGASCILIQDSRIKEVFFAAKNNISKQTIAEQNRKAIKSGKKEILFSGISWGVFWKQKQNIILSSPVYHQGRLIAGASLVISLENIYNNLRESQRILFIYILMNTFFLTIIGVFRFSKIFIKPLHHLVQRAETYKEDEEIFFTNEKGSNEFNQLSKALNRMLYGISARQEELRSMVWSLEKANRDLKKAQNDIIHAEKLASAGRLSAGIAHEIGNPIAIIMGYLDLLKRDDTSEEEKKDFINRTENEINRIHNIIRQLLDLSRPSDGEIKNISIHEIISDVVETFKFQKFMSNIDINISLLAETDIIKADPSQLRQIFLNLMINASDAIESSRNHDKGELNILTDTEEDQNLLRIIFSDNGEGIPENEIVNIFDPFYTTKEPGKGTGLGLSVCYMMIDSIGGRIKAVSEVNKGTSIIISLPIYDSVDLLC